MDDELIVDSFGPTPHLTQYQRDGMYLKLGLRPPGWPSTSSPTPPSTPFIPIAKFNPHHDNRGRFTNVDGEDSADPRPLSSWSPPPDAASPDRVHRVMAQVNATKVPTTDVAYDHLRGVEGAYSPERAAIHEQLIKAALDKAKDVPSEHKAIIMGGLGGAGKSSILRANAISPSSVAGKLGIKYSSYADHDDPENFIKKGDGLGDPVNFLTLNPDEFKEDLAHMGAVPKIGDLSPMEATTMAHNESSHITDSLAESAVAQGKNIIWDITLNSESSGRKRKGPLDIHGYHTSAVYVRTSIAQSLKAAAERHLSGQRKWAQGQGIGGRMVPPVAIESAADPTGIWTSKNEAAFEALRRDGLFDRYMKLDNENFAGRMIYQHGFGEDDIEPVDKSAGYPVVIKSRQISDITDKIRSYRDGSLSWAALLDDLGHRDYVNWMAPQRDKWDIYAWEDNDPSMPGSWMEVERAAAEGLLSPAELNEIRTVAYNSHRQ